MPIDVYYAATRMALSVLSEKFITECGTVRYMPDFTHGMWMTKKPLNATKL